MIQSPLFNDLFDLQMNMAHLVSKIFFNQAFGQLKKEKHVWMRLFRCKPKQKVHAIFYHRFSWELRAFQKKFDSIEMIKQAGTKYWEILHILLEIGNWSYNVDGISNLQDLVNHSSHLFPRGSFVFADHFFEDINNALKFLLMPLEVRFIFTKTSERLFKWRLMVNHFVNNHSQTPNVTVLVCDVLLQDLWSGILRRA